jgi:PAS domain S-box-containing protein
MWRSGTDFLYNKSMLESDIMSEQAETLRKLLNAVEDPILLIDLSGKVITGNSSAAMLLNTTLPLLVGKSIYDGVQGQPELVDESRIKEIASSRRSAQFEATKDGACLEIRLYPMPDEAGEVEKIAIYVHDVARRTAMEEALRQAEAMYRNIWENATEGIFQISLEGRFLSANPALARIHGYETPEELISSIHDVGKDLYVEPERRRDLIRLLGRFGRAENFEVRVFRKDRTIHWISINARLVRDASGNPLYHEGTMRDITKRKENEAAIQESEERYRTVVELSNDGMAIVENNVHIFVNQRFVEMFEYNTPEEVIGTPVGLLIHPDDQELVESIRIQRERGEPVPQRYEMKGITRKGTIIYLEASGTAMTYRGRRVSVSYLKDITERKKAEEALIESRNELERLNRAKGKAVNHISHELKTPLALSRASVRILRRKLSENPSAADSTKMLDMLERNLDRLLEVSTETDEIFRASQDLEASGLRNDIDRLEQRMESLSPVSDDMRVHTRAIKQWIDRHMPGGHGRFKTINLPAFLDNTIEKIRYFTRRRKVRIVFEGGESRFNIVMNPEILQEVLEALLKNAVENTPDGGQVLVRTEKRANTAWIDVIDTGVGIPEEDQAYVFDGLFHATETDLYSTKRSYDFGAGGKGLDLLKLKVYAKRFGFQLTMASTRCPYIPTERDVCPGDVAECPHISSPEECAVSGGSTFSLAFRTSEGPVRERKKALQQSTADGTDPSIIS